MILLFFLILPTLAAPRFRSSLIDQTHSDFKDFAEDRMHHMIALSHGAPPRYLTISVVLTQCSEEHQSEQRISHGWLQTVLEEETCGTKRMREWCEMHPEETVSLMTRDGETSSMAQFRCEARKTGEGKRRIRSEWMNLIFPTLVAIFVLGVIYNFYKLCKEQAEQRKEKNIITEIEAHSFETVNLDSSKSKSQDSSIGTLFTL